MSRQQDTPRNAAEPASSAAAPRTGASHARRVLTPLLTVVGLLVVWELVVDLGLIPNFLLPTPVQVVQALVNDISLIVGHAATTLVETAIGLLIGVALGFAIAVLMDRFEGFYLALQPLVTISQTIPTIAIAPLLVLWFGYGLAPKVILIVITTFFPITVSLISGFRSVDPDVIDLMRTMNASRWQIFRYANLRISATYAIVGAVIAEWLGGNSGLGVYMTRVRKSFSYDRMFAVIIVISALSLGLMKLVDLLQRICMPWKRAEGNKR